MKYGIFGCTADPFTYAHYEIVNKVLKEKLVDKVIVIPTVVDYYRKDKERMFTNEQRLEIIKKWFGNSTNVIVDDYEYKLIDRLPELQKDRRFYHTLNDITARYGSENEFYTIIGGDSWNNIESWYRFRDIATMTSFIVVKREDTHLNYYINYSEYYSQPYRTVEIDDKFKSVSATEIRKHLIDVCSCMSIGPSGDQFNVYMEELEDYKETGKTYKDHEKEYDDINEVIENLLDNDKAKDTILDAEHVIAHTPIFDLIQGKDVEKDFRPVKIKSPDWVTIVVEKDGKFLMEKQLRYGLNKEFEEFPCGMIEEDEQPIVAALRELKEETGIEVKKYTLRYLGKFAANPAFMTNYMHYFYISLEDYEQGETNLDEHEKLTSYWVDKRTAFDNFLKSEGSSIGGCCWMLLLKEGMVF